MLNRPPNANNPIPRVVLLLLVAITLFWPQSSAAQQQTYTKADLQGFQQLQTRIAALNVTGIPLTNYHLAKAQAWLDFSKEEYFDNDRSGIVEATFEEAKKLLDQLEPGVMTSLDMTTPVLEGERLEQESWRALEELKPQRLDCAGNLIARLEVQLVHVEHELHELGPIHAAPYRQAVQRMLEKLKAVDCQPAGKQSPVLPSESGAEVKP